VARSSHPTGPARAEKKGKNERKRKSRHCLACDLLIYSKLQSSDEKPQVTAAKPLQQPGQETRQAPSPHQPCHLLQTSNSTMSDDPRIKAEAYLKKHKIPDILQVGVDLLVDQRVQIPPSYVFCI
jgi:hypothetical protein